MQQLRELAFLLAFTAACGISVAVTPVQKVITLLEDIKSKVEAEGLAEATTYDQFACFCKDQTGVKSTSITSGKDSIDTVSADIESKTALKDSKSSEIRERQSKHETLTTELQKTVQQCQQDQAEYEASAADLSKALKGLTGAITALENAKTTSFVELKDTVERSMDLAETLDATAAKRRKKVDALLQAASKLKVDPVDPAYKYHSHGILETITELKTDFSRKKQDLDDEWAKTQATCTSTQASLSDQISQNSQAISTLGTEVSTLKGEIASDRTDLVNKEATLKDDQLYLTDLTQRCELRAKDWDQRSQMRADELEALTGALDVMKNNVSSLDAAVNQRALLQNPRKGNRDGGGVSTGAMLSGSGRRPKAAQVLLSRSPSFLQDLSAKVRRHGFLARAEGSAALQAKQDSAAALLRGESRRLKSSTLSMLAARVETDPFAKVKTLIQKLIERLLAEATAEATKKSFCDKEVGKAKQDRDNRFQDAQRLSVELEGLESKYDSLDAEIKTLGVDIAFLTDALANATADRKVEKEVNMQTLKDARDGLDAVKQGITILKVFYKRAAKATVLAQVSASPVDEDTSGAGFEGAYQGQQEASKGIIGMLEVIKTDFERTIRMTESGEKQSAESFVEFDRASKTDISGKETKLTLNTEDLATTNSTMNQKMDDLRTAMNLLDSAVKVIEELKPTCIDTHMSYEDRVAKREEEIAALKRALCILDPQGVEPDCSAPAPP